MRKQYCVLGLMSGTSLDGVDLALCTFTKNQKRWDFKIEETATFSYSPKWHKRLSGAHMLNGRDLIELHNHYGRFLGTLVKKFLSRGKLISPEFISSHGHTIFHQPSAGFTFQLGDGTALSAACGFPVISDFRNMDVQFGGQGAPLVPVGDRFLFSTYDVCINLGGIANLSFESRGERLAWDICFVNMGLNFLTGRIGRKFDRAGKLARSGKIIPKLLKELLQLPNKIGGKKPALTREQFEKFVCPLIVTKFPISDLLRTFVEYAAVSIATDIRNSKGKTILLTGGGAHNDFLVDRIRKNSPEGISVEVGSKKIIDFKEAIIFAFLGILNREGLVNALKSVTGSSIDTCGGISAGFGRTP